MKYIKGTLKLIISLTILLPFVAMLWFYDIIVDILKISYSKLYLYALPRSVYLQERELINSYQQGNDYIMYNN